MHSHRMLKVLALVVAFLTARVASATPIVIDSVNQNAAPIATYSTFEIGWTYTPTFDYDLIGIQTKFGVHVDDRTVVLQVFDGHPLDGGTLLRSAEFTPEALTFASGFFSPLHLTAFEDYFIGFQNIDGLSANITEDAGAIGLLPSWHGPTIATAGLYPDIQPFTPPAAVTQPILEFMAEDPTPVPEPSSLVLLGIGLAGLLVRRQR